MPIDWTEVERLVKPSPNYETLIQRLLEVFEYGFVKDHYNHSMEEAQGYAGRLLGNDPKGRYGKWLEALKAGFQSLAAIGVKDYLDFIRRVETKEKLAAFHENAGLALSVIIDLLKYLLKWVLPTKSYLAELVDEDALKALELISTLRQNGVRFTLDILETGRTKQGREEMARRAGVPEAFIFEMVNRADFTRLPFVRGSTVRNYFHAGYDSLQKLANADLAELSDAMIRYGQSIGKDLKHGMEVDSGIVIARILPALVEQA